MRADLVVDALELALRRGGPSPSPDPPLPPGSQVVGLAFGRKARDAVAESCFATLKKEPVHRRSWRTRRELIGEVFEFVEGSYNITRRHSTLGYLYSAQFEDQNTININKDNG